MDYLLTRWVELSDKERTRHKLAVILASIMVFVMVAGHYIPEIISMVFVLLIKGSVLLGVAWVGWLVFYGIAGELLDWRERRQDAEDL